MAYYYLDFNFHNYKILNALKIFYPCLLLKVYLEESSGKLVLDLS